MKRNDELHGSGKERRIQVVNAPVDPITTQDLVEQLVRWTKFDQLRVAVGINANVCNLATTNPAFRKLLTDIDLGYADGQSIVWSARLLGQHVPERIATTDLILPLAARAADERLNLFLFGAAPGVAELAAQQLHVLHPELQIATQHGYVPESELESLLQSIHENETDILLVGLGDPYQLAWIREHETLLQVPVVLTCGGLFDWISGKNKRAPQWMIASGLEWLWRFLIEPRRLARRYLLGNPAFVFRLAQQKISTLAQR